MLRVRFLFFVKCEFKVEFMKRNRRQILERLEQSGRDTLFFSDGLFSEEFFQSGFKSLLKASLKSGI